MNSLLEALNSTNTAACTQILAGNALSALSGQVLAVQREDGSLLLVPAASFPAPACKAASPKASHMNAEGTATLPGADATAHMITLPNTASQLLFSGQSTLSTQFQQQQQMIAPSVNKDAPQLVVSQMQQATSALPGTTTLVVLGAATGNTVVQASDSVAATQTALHRSSGTATNSSDSEDGPSSPHGILQTRTSSEGAGCKDQRLACVQISSKEKNRQAQQRFRARQKELIAVLKDQVDDLKKQLANKQSAVERLTSENGTLRAQLEALAQPAAAPQALQLPLSQLPQQLPQQSQQQPVLVFSMPQQNHQQQHHHQQPAPVGMHVAPEMLQVMMSLLSSQATTGAPLVAHAPLAASS